MSVNPLLTYKVTRRAWGWSWSAWIDKHLVAVGWSRKEWHAEASAQEVLFRRVKERR